MVLRFVVPLLCGLTLLTSVGSAVAADKYWVYFGTYTGGKDGSKGIYRSEFDTTTGSLTEPQVAAEVGSPSFLAIAPSGTALYAIGETTGNKKDGGGVYAFRLDPATGRLTKLNQLTSGGAGPCHIVTDPEGKFAVVANYSGGSCAAFRLKPDGSLDARTAFVQHKGNSVNPGRQKEPHAHCGTFDNSGKFAFVVDLGLDKVMVYNIDRETGALTATTPIQLPAGSGPRHIQFTPDNRIAFVCGELDCTANVVKMDPATGQGKVVQSVSTLPSGKPGKGDSTAEVRIHPSGKFVYVSNRGHNSIAAFGWDGQKLTPIGHASEGIKTPRNFNLDPSGKWMLVANQDGNDVVVFAVGDDGLPKPTGAKVRVPKPVCVKFLAKP